MRSYCKYVNEDGDYCYAVFEDGKLVDGGIIARKEQAGDWNVYIQ